MSERAQRVVQHRLPRHLGRAHQAVVIEGAGQNRYAAAPAPQTAVGHDRVQPLRIRVEQFAVEPAEDDPVGVEDIDQPGETQPQPVDQFLGGPAYGGVGVLRTEQIARLLEQGDLGTRRAAAAVRKASGSASTSRQPFPPQ